MMNKTERQELKKLLVDLYIEQDTLTRHIIKHGEPDQDDKVSAKRNRAVEDIIDFVDSIVFHFTF